MATLMLTRMTREITRLTEAVIQPVTPIILHLAIIIVRQEESQASQMGQALLREMDQSHLMELPINKTAQIQVTIPHRTSLQR